MIFGEIESALECFCLFYSIKIIAEGKMSSAHEEDDRDFDGDINVDDVDSDSRISCESDIDLDGSCYDENEMHIT